MNRPSPLSNLVTDRTMKLIQEYFPVGSEWYSPSGDEVYRVLSYEWVTETDLVGGVDIEHPTAKCVRTSSIGSTSVSFINGVAQEPVINTVGEMYNMSIGALEQMLSVNGDSITDHRKALYAYKQSLLVRPLSVTEHDLAYYRMKANQHWEMAGLASKDGDSKATAIHTEKAKEYERLAREVG